MIIEIVESIAELEKLAPEWQGLYGRCPRATPFQSPQWLMPWVRHLFKGGEISALALRNERELIGFVPLFCWGTPRCVSFLGAGISDYGDLLFAPGCEDECVAAVWSLLEKRRHQWERLDLQEVRSGSGILKGWPPVECSVCPVLELSTYPSTMDRKHRNDIRRARNKLASRSGFEFAMADETNLSGRLEEFTELHRANWTEIDNSLYRFYAEVAARFLASGSLRLCSLRMEDRAIAAIYAFVKGSTLYFYLSAFDAVMAKLSPGASLIGWMIERAVGEGLAQVDFLRGSEAYKYLWGAQDAHSYKIVATEANEAFRSGRV